MNKINYEQAIDMMVSVAQSFNNESSTNEFTRPDGWKVTITVTAPEKARTEDAAQIRYWKKIDYHKPEENKPKELQPVTLSDEELSNSKNWYISRDVSELSFTEKCAALCAHVALAGNGWDDPLAIMMLDWQEEGVPDILKTFESRSDAHYSDAQSDILSITTWIDYPRSLERLLDDFRNVGEDTKSIVFALCEMVACVGGDPTDGAISLLTTIAESWGWTWDKAEQMVDNLKNTHPDFFLNTCYPRLYK